MICPLPAQGAEPMTVIIPPCQEPCCRIRRGECPRRETPEEAGKRIADAAMKTFATALSQHKEPNRG